MAVLLREKANIRGEEMEIKVFRPSGALSRSNRERAEKLDDFLAGEMPRIAKRVMRFPKDKALKKWHQFGKELHKVLDNNDLVSRSDLESGLLWEAVKQHLPKTIDLKGAGEARDANTKYDGHRGHFPGCYAIAEHAWEDVKWLKRWADWMAIYHRESMSRDKRVLCCMRKEMTRMKQYPPKNIFSEILKSLAAQTTGKDIRVLGDSDIEEKVHRAFEKIQVATT